MPLSRALLLIWLLLGGQAHACSSAWVRPDGRECKACVAGPCLDDAALHEAPPAAFGASAANDCHDCCTLNSCGDEGEKPAAAKAQPYHPVFAWIDAAVILTAQPIVTVRAEIAFIEEGFPNAPPSARSSRGPPSN